MDENNHDAPVRVVSDFPLMCCKCYDPLKGYRIYNKTGQKQYRMMNSCNGSRSPGHVNITPRPLIVVRFSGSSARFLIFNLK
jgi:hypothetical protein